MSAIFLSDFDGTVTETDFYKLVLNAIGPEGWDFFYEYRQSGKVDYHLLNRIFGWKRLDEEQYQQLLDAVVIDKTFNAFKAQLDALKIDFAFVSAGFDHYINRVLEARGLFNLKVVTNPGGLYDGSLQMLPDVDGPYYSPLFGIDKALVVKAYRSQYDHIYFAGDSEPDLGAALLADVVFAKGELIPQLEAMGKPFIPFTTFEEIGHALSEKGHKALSEELIFNI